MVCHWRDINKRRIVLTNSTLMNNTIIAPRNYGNIDFIDPLLPCNNQEVLITHVENQFLGRGMYKLLLHFMANDNKIILTCTTTDSRLIDNWRDEDGEPFIPSIHKAIEIILENNQNELEEFIHINNEL